jgi:hypothetical protein
MITRGDTSYRAPGPLGQDDPWQGMIRLLPHFRSAAVGIRRFMEVAFFSVGLSIAFAAIPASAQTPPAEPVHDVDALARETQNPISSLISLPLQFNFNSGGDLEDRSLFDLKFQPVIPFKASTNWNVIARTIVPIDSVPGPEGVRYSGIGDIEMQIFFSPAKPGSIVWGVGPIFSLPTATTFGAETGTWAAGPGAVVLKMTGPWVFGGLIYQLWPMSDAGGDPETDRLTFQWFVNYNFGHGWALTTAPLNFGNWNADSGNEWTVPLGFGISRTTVFNRRPINLGLQYYYNVEKPDGAAGQQLRIQVSFLYPR